MTRVLVLFAVLLVAGCGALGSAGGPGGGDAGSAGGSSEPGICGARYAFGTHLLFPFPNALASERGDTYAHDGPATVEQSTTSLLVLTYDMQQDAGVTGGDGGAITRQASIRGLDPMPLLPPGAIVWLSVHPNHEPAVWYRTDAWSMSVRDREGGTLLFGAGLDYFNAVSSPVRIGPPVEDCVVRDYESPCAPPPTVTMTYNSVEVEGDTPVIIHDSRPGKVSLGGVEYDVRLTARKLNPGCPLNSANVDGIALDIQATNLADLVQHLDVAAR